jgi:hypothetical protein
MTGAPAAHLAVVPEDGFIHRTVGFTPLDGYAIEATDWLWTKRIPAGELTVLAGDGGLGKSTFAAWLASQVTTGQVTGLNGTRTVAVVLGEDDPARTLKPRYRAAGADMAKVAVVSASQGAGEEVLVLPDDLDQLADYVALNRPDLLIVDPLTAHLNGAVDSHRDGGRGGMRQVLNPLSRIAQLYGTTVLAVFHLNKGAGPAAQRIGGSAGIRNAARNVLVFAQHPEAREGGDDDGRRIIGHDKCNYGPTQPSLEATIAAAPVLDDQGAPIVNKDGEAATTSLLAVGGESSVDYADALRAASADGRDDDEGRDALGEALAFVRIELADGPIGSRKLETAAADAGISKRTLMRARAELGVKAAKGASGWTVSLPDPLGTLGTLAGSSVTDGDPGPSENPKDAKSAKGAASLELGHLDRDDTGWTTPA